MYAKPKRNEVAPESFINEKFGDKEVTTTHPAFAMIGASRVSGHANLYGSDFVHNAYMVIRIKNCESHRHLNRDWYFGREEYIEVALSESQWATFVSAPNIGDGTPCTLIRRDGCGIPGIPALDRTHLVKAEMDKELAQSVADIEAAIKELDGLGLSAKKAAAMKTKLEMARKRLIDSVPFAADQFAEYVEETVERGKQEIHGYMTNVITRAGITALSDGSNMPLAIEGKE